MKETSLYEGVRKYFEEQGFLVRGEVKDIDVLAVKDDLVIGIELKKNLTVGLLVQGALRQKVCDLVYIAVPRPLRLKKDKSFKNMLHLLRRLELGLLFVDVEKEEAEVVLDPAFYNLDKARQASSKKRQQLLREIRGRSLHLNKGGCNRTRLMTAYREEALKAVAYLRIHEKGSPKELKTFGVRTSLLRDNYYGWFRKLERGVYCLEADKSAEMAEFEAIIESFCREMSA